MSFRDVRMRGFQDRSEVADVVALLDARLTPLPPETVSLAEAAERVLAVDVVAEVAVPAFDRSAMDGYAVIAEQTFGADGYNPLELLIIGEALPGRPFAGTVHPGQAVRIMTGAPLPAGADAVVQAEAAQEHHDRVDVSEAVSPGRHVGRVGEDVAAGTVVLTAGRRLRPQDLGVLSSIGVSRLEVVRRPTVTILITGDELLPAGSKPEGCRIVDSNSVMLEALVRRDGGLPLTAPLIPDKRELVRAALQDADADVVLISGGSSVGQEDHAPRVLAELGELSVHGVALRPASPAGLGFLKGRPVFLMPGNPVSCLCAYDLFAGRAVRRLGGRKVFPAGGDPKVFPAGGDPWADLPYRTATLPLARKIVSAVGRVDYVRVMVRDGQIEPLATSGASILSSTTRADGFVLMPRDSEGAGAGEMVTVYLYDVIGPEELRLGGR